MIESILIRNAFIEEIEEGVWTTIKSSERGHDYDEKIGVYDAVIGNPLYNRVVWGNKLSNYQAFCREALASKTTGYVLDAGCGSLIFTGEIYAQYTERPLILVDRSLGMLRKAKSRLIAMKGRLPDNVYLLQGDLFALPFRDGVFETVQSFGMLHIFNDTQKFVRALLKMKSETGTLYFNSLVGNNWLGRRYLEILQRAGEVALVYTSESLMKEIEKTEMDIVVKTVGNMAYFSFQKKLSIPS